MITLIVTGVDYIQLAEILSSVKLCLITIHLQKREAEWPQEKIQTQS